MIYDIWLATQKSFPYRKQRKLIDTYGSSENVYRELKNSLPCGQASLDIAKRIEYECNKYGVFLSDLKEFELHPYSDLPLFYFCRGTVKKNNSSVAIVGSRRCSEYGKKITADIAAKCAKNGVTVISGMARGVDGCAHTASIRNGGYTIAVLGTGPDECYPKEHRSLMDAIINTGLVISEYPPNTHGNTFTFPERNRIIAALSDRTIITEAREGSGSLITANHAARYGKPVYAVPGRIDSPESAGCLNLLETGKATVCTMNNCLPVPTQLSTEDLFQDPPCPNLSNEKKAILNLLGPVGHTIPLSLLLDRTSKEQNIPVNVLMNTITELEIDDIVTVEGDLIWLL